MTPHDFKDDGTGTCTSCSLSAKDNAFLAAHGNSEIAVNMIVNYLIKKVQK